MCFSDGMEIWDWWHIVVEYGTLPISGFVIEKWGIFPFKGFKDGNFQKIYPSKFYYVVNKLMMANISDIMIWNNDSKIFICRKGLDLVNFCYMKARKWKRKPNMLIVFKMMNVMTLINTFFMCTNCFVWDFFYLPI